MRTVDDVARLIQIKSRIVIYLFIFPSVAYDPEMTKIRSITNSTLFYLFHYMNIRNISSSRLYDRLYSRLYNRLQSVNGLLVSCTHLIIDFTLSLRTHSQTSLFAYTTYADNMALPAFARRCCSNRSVSPARRAHRRLRVHVGTERRTDGHRTVS